MAKKIVVSIMMSLIMILLAACGGESKKGASAPADNGKNAAAEFSSQQSTNNAAPEAAPVDTGNAGDESYSTESSSEYEEKLPKTLAELAAPVSSLDGVYTRDKLDYTPYTDRFENISSYEELYELMYGYCYDAKVEIPLNDSASVESVFDEANDYVDKNETAIIVVSGDVTVDGSQITNEESYRVNEKTSTYGVCFIVKSGSTFRFTDAGTTINQGYGGYYQPTFIIENGGKLIIDGKSYFSANEAMFLVAEGGSMEIVNSNVDLMGLINLGTVTVTTTDLTDYEANAWVSVHDCFYN